MPRRFQSGGTAEDLPTTTGGTGTTNVQQTGEITGFPSVATTEATQQQVTDRPAVQPVSGVIPGQMKVGLTESETVTPQSTTINTNELVDFGQQNADATTYCSYCNSRGCCC